MNRNGFTLVEVMVALTILTVGILGLMSTSLLVTRMMGHSQRTVLATAFVKQTMEQTRLTGCASPVNGSSVLKRGTGTVDSLSWTFIVRKNVQNASDWSVVFRSKVQVTPGRWSTTKYETELSCVS